jgi:hypothetical protein
VKYPSALSLLSTGLEIDKTVSAAGEAAVAPSVMSTMNQNTLDEMVVLMQDRLEIYFDMKEPEDQQVLTPQQLQRRAEEGILNFLGYKADVDSYEVNIRKIIDELMAKVSAGTDLIEGRTADMQVALGKTTDTGDVFAIDLNKDGIDDFVVFLDGDEEKINGMLFLSGRN